MKVCEVFKSLSGEGVEVGKPTVFLRLSGCNLKCDFCDTQYHNQGIETSIKEAKKMIIAYHLKHVTFTGGEPLQQQEEIEKLIETLPSDYQFSLETNGTIYTRLNFDTIVVSPKKQKINMKVLKSYSNQNNTFFKFVYEDKNDKWWEPIIFSLKIPRNRVYIMPEGKTRDEQLSKLEEVADYCIINNYNMSMRMHVIIWNQKRGV